MSSVHQNISSGDESRLLPSFHGHVYLRGLKVLGGEGGVNVKCELTHNNLLQL
jgi:hypothetical protein